MEDYDDVYEFLESVSVYCVCRLLWNSHDQKGALWSNVIYVKSGTINYV